jgi:hypothetical protein
MKFIISICTVMCSLIPVLLLFYHKFIILFILCFSVVCDVNRTPSKKDRFRQRWSEKDEACFGTPIDNILDQDFDFEKNLALFNKQVSYLFSDILILMTAFLFTVLDFSHGIHLLPLY